MASDSRLEPHPSPVRRTGIGAAATLVDADWVGRCRARPEAGPAILFLTGGSALRATSRALTRLTHRSVHLVTPFDSGGSSASLRRAFGMPAIGDLRNRLLALADPDAPAADALQALFGHRLPRDAAPAALRGELRSLASGRHPLVAAVPDAARSYARLELERVAAALPADFDLRGASVGNLVLTGSYLSDRRLDAAIDRFRDVLGVLGRVLPTLDADLHLEARLRDGTRVRGQHRITGKDGPPLATRIEELRLVTGLEDDAAPAGHTAPFGRYEARGWRFPRGTAPGRRRSGGMTMRSSS